MIWQCWDGNSESLLDLLQYLGVRVGSDKADGETLGTESSSSSYSVEVRVGIGGCVLEVSMVVMLGRRT